MYCQKSRPPPPPPTTTTTATTTTTTTTTTATATATATTTTTTRANKGQQRPPATTTTTRTTTTTTTTTAATCKFNIISDSNVSIHFKYFKINLGEQHLAIAHVSPFISLRIPLYCPDVLLALLTPLTPTMTGGSSTARSWASCECEAIDVGVVPQSAGGCEGSELLDGPRTLKRMSLR